MNNLKQIGVGLHNFNSSHEHFPSGVMCGGSSLSGGTAVAEMGKHGGWAWSAFILEFCDQQSLADDLQVGKSRVWHDNSNLDDHSSASIFVRPMLLLLKIKRVRWVGKLEHQQARQTTLAMLEQSLLKTLLAYQIRIVPMMTRLKTKQPQETTIQFCSLVLQSRCANY